MTMRKLHLWVGLLTVVVFLITGQFMRRHQPPMTAFTPEVRLLFRSRHIYILAGGLVNLMLGLYLQRSPNWRGRAQVVGSILLLASPAHLIVAFILLRHVTGDWGDLDEHDCQENELSVVQCFRLFSSYTLSNGTKLWIITEADRSATTLLLPSEY